MGVPETSHIFAFFKIKFSLQASILPSWWKVSSRHHFPLPSIALYPEGQHGVSKQGKAYHL